MRKGNVKPGYKFCGTHMVFDIKMDGKFTRKSRLVVDGHKTSVPASITYSSVVSRDSVRIALMLASLNDLDIFSCDIGNAYLEATTQEKVCICAGEKFGEAVKSLVTGGGSADFFIDRQCYEDGTDNGLYMMRLLLMTQMNGCKAKAKFFMVDRSRSSEDCTPACGGDLPGSLWYETEILVTSGNR